MIGYILMCRFQRVFCYFRTGWIGFILIFVCCFVSAYTGDILGDCWTMTQDRRPDLRQGCVRYPYSAIGEEAYGKWGR